MTAQSNAQMTPKQPNTPQSISSLNIILLQGELLKKTQDYGKSIWLQLGEDTFKEFTLSAISQRLAKNFQGDPITDTLRLQRHLFLFWKRGYYKSSMIEKFFKLLKTWKTHKIGNCTAESLRGSVTGKSPNYVFHVPGVLKGDLIAVPEFSGVPLIKGIEPILLDWLGTGNIHLELVSLSAALQINSVVSTMKAWRVTPNQGGYSFHTDSLCIAANHTQTRTLNKLTSAVYDRFLVLHFDNILTAQLAKSVIKNMSNLRQNTSLLMQAWEFYGNMSVQGQLPKIKDKWIDSLPDLEPRLLGKYVSTVYSHAYIMQPKRHKNVSGKYSNLILDYKDHDFALQQIPKYIQGYDVIESYFGASSQPKSNTNKINVNSIVQTFKSVSSRQVADSLGISQKQARNILNELKTAGKVKMGSKIGKAVQWVPV